SEEHTSELQSLTNLVCRLLLEKKKVEATSITAQATDKHGPTGLGMTRDAFAVHQAGSKHTVTPFTAGRVPMGLPLTVDNLYTTPAPPRPAPVVSMCRLATATAPCQTRSVRPTSLF